ncbi:MAG: hypothetical protein EOS82_00270 [Mesorhizobium sp.]|nr:MAG: hypothetical protein EOR89_00045 [Mesorhizobium sp.]RWQ58228.1 MAG: hypothetical protein EOS82_00270 [Mesorhizobium sp.]RWQ61015.1 MAG: hypothetical protein EOS83_02415 [Mesorhizobium sp.]
MQRIIRSDPVKIRVALPAADPPDNATAIHEPLNGSSDLSGFVLFQWTFHAFAYCLPRPVVRQHSRRRPCRSGGRPGAHP